MAYNLHSFPPLPPFWDFCSPIWEMSGIRHYKLQLRHSRNRTWRAGAWYRKTSTPLCIFWLQGRADSEHGRAVYKEIMNFCQKNTSSPPRTAQFMAVCVRSLKGGSGHCWSNKTANKLRAHQAKQKLRGERKVRWDIQEGQIHACVLSYVVTLSCTGGNAPLEVIPLAVLLIVIIGQSRLSWATLEKKKRLPDTLLALADDSAGKSFIRRGKGGHGEKDGEKDLCSCWCPWHHKYFVCYMGRYVPGKPGKTISKSKAEILSRAPARFWGDRCCLYLGQ